MSSPSAILMGMFEDCPTDLEVVALQGANDLKVSGFGQRLRAALRRNLKAGSNTVLPDYMAKDMPGPDLVRHFNGLFLLHAVGNPLGNQPHDVDRELFNALRGSLDTIGKMVAYMWTGPLGNVASAFLDDDNLPPPFCPMYFNARDLVNGKDFDLHPQVVKVVDRVKVEIEKTPVWTRAVLCASELQPNTLNALKVAKEAFREGADVQEGEQAEQWGVRLYRLLSEGRSEVPTPLLLVNRLITATVAAMVSLTIWSYEVEKEDLLVCKPQPFGDGLPDGFDIVFGHFNELLSMSPGSSLQLKKRKVFTGIATTVALQFSFTRDPPEETVRLSLVRLAAYEDQLGLSLTS